jgi:hypothetical protein
MLKGEKVLSQSKRTAPPPIFNFQKFELRKDFSIGDLSIWYLMFDRISNLENASQNLIHLPLTICKKTLKRIYKRICKTKHMVQSVVQNVKNEEINPRISYEILLVQFLVTYALTLCKLVQLCTSISALVCVGINHQKGGRLKGN